MSTLCVSQMGMYTDFRDYLKPEFRQEMCRSLLVAVVDPNLDTQRATVEALRRFNFGSVRCYSSYPAPEQAPSLTDQGFDVILVSLEVPQKALAATAALSADPAVTVMVYAADASQELVRLAQHSGAREFLDYPLAKETMKEAFDRTADRLRGIDPTRKSGSLHVFCGAKGGSGVTTVATNFAVALAQETQQKTLLIDLDLPLGDAGLLLGVASRYSTLDALNRAQELDSAYLTGILTDHPCGLSVISAPGVHHRLDLHPGAADRMVAVARLDFEHVVIDSGSHWSWDDGGLFRSASRIYLVTQVGVPELRNSNRVITSCLTAFDHKLDVVLNRFGAKGSGLDEETIEKALTRAPAWRIPSDFATVRRMQNDATPLAMESSPVSKAIHRIARQAAGLEETGKKRFGLFA